jgi:hypothetical protein
MQRGHRQQRRQTGIAREGSERSSNGSNKDGNTSRRRKEGFSTRSLYLGENYLSVEVVIVSLTSLVVGAEALSAMVEIKGIEYLVSVPLTASCILPALGQCTKLQIYPVYKADRRELYGLLTPE